MSNLEQQLEEFGAAALRAADERNEYKRRIAGLAHDCRMIMAEITLERARADATEAHVKVLEEALRQVADARMPGEARRIARAALASKEEGGR